MLKIFNLLAIFTILLMFANIFTVNASSNTVTDIDGNVYHTVKIGTQTWMVENLKTTKYNDGTSIPLVSDGTEWSNLTTSGYCFYNNDTANESRYGALYNWYTVETGKLAPTGWHVPTDAEWTTLENYLIENSYNYDSTTTGNKIGKAMAATSGWSLSTKEGAIGNVLTRNNSSGFTGLPGGLRFFLGSYTGIGSSGGWWSSTDEDTYCPFRGLSRSSNTIIGAGGASKRYGFSVRCIRDY